MWTCPECGRRFSRPSQIHSCRPVEVDDLLARRPDKVRRLYRRFALLVARCGPHRVEAVPSGIQFRVESAFAAVVPRATHLKVELLLPTRIEDPRIAQILTVSRNRHAHSFEVWEPEALDAAVAKWIKAAYLVQSGD